MSWRLRFSSPPADLETLTFVHQFRGPGPEQNGELRLQLQTPSSRRISATIPPDRPYTLVLASEPKEDTSLNELNEAQSRLIFSPRRIVHEFTAPLSRLTIAVEAGREAGEDRSQYVVSTNFVAQRTHQWFTDHVKLLAENGLEIQLLESSAQLFPGGIPDPEEGEVEALNLTQGEVPLMGTVVGVRQVFVRPASSDKCFLHFSQTPGDFSDLIINTVTASGETSALAPFNSVSGSADAASSAALSFAVDIDSLSPPVQLTSSSPSAPIQPLVVSELRLHKFGALITLAALIAAVTAVLKSTRRWTITRRVAAAACLVAAGVVSVAAISVQQHHEAQPTSVKAAFKHVLSRIYHAVNIRSRREALNELDHVLENDLLETTFLEVVETLEEDEDGALVSVNSVSIDEVEAVQATSQSSISAKVSWQVTGTVYHWGHSHDRIHQIRGRVELVHTDEHWKISNLQLLGSEVKIKNSGS